MRQVGRISLLYYGNRRKYSSLGFISLVPYIIFLSFFDFVAFQPRDE